MFDSFHLVGVNSKYMLAEYITIISSSLFSGRCLKVIGLRPSGPGDFLFVKWLKTSLSSDLLSQCGAFNNMLFVVSVLSLYIVSVVALMLGKWVFSKNSRVSEPGSVIVPSGFCNTPLSLIHI